MNGTWEFISAELGGQKLPEAALKSMTLQIEDGQYTVNTTGPVDRGFLTTGASKSPKEMDVTGEEGHNKGKTILAIYEQDGDLLKICYDLEGKKRPTEFKTLPSTKLFLAVYKRRKQ